MRRLKEGPGAGYTINIKDLVIQKDSIKIEEITENEDILFTAEIEPGVYQISASGYDWGGTEWAHIDQATIKAAYTYGKVEEDDPTYYIPESFNIVNYVYGAGWVHCKVGEQDAFLDVRTDDDLLDIESFEFESFDLGDMIEIIRENSYDDFEPDPDEKALFERVLKKI